MVYIFLALLGAVMGSFVGAVVWRLHHKRDFVRERSECEHCGHVLQWYDLVPIVSWLSLRGKCRYCRAPISVQHPLVELLVAGLFVASYVFWPWPLGAEPAMWVLFGLWLIFVAGLVTLALYDLKWMLLPDSIVKPLIVLGVVYGVLRGVMIEQATVLEALLGVGLGIGVLGGFYYLLNRVSQERWVGFGDVKLGIFMGAALGWQAGLVILVLANFIGFLVVLPGLLTKKLTKTSRVPFGPFLIAGFLIAGLFSEQIISWYLGLSGFDLLIGA